MQRRVCRDDFRIEAFEDNVTVTALLCINRSRERVGVGQFEARSDAYGGGASRERKIDLDRLDTEPDEHRVHGRGAGGACRTQRPDQHLGVVHRRHESSRSRLERPAHFLDGLGVVSILATEIRDQDVSVEDDYGHSRRSSSR